MIPTIFIGKNTPNPEAAHKNSAVSINSTPEANLYRIFLIIVMKYILLFI